MQLIINWIVSAIAILIVAYILPGVSVASFWTALVVAVVLGLVNAVIRPIILALTLPVNVMTLGLFTFVINALLVMLAARVVDGFAVANFWWALLFSLLLSLVNMLFRGTTDRPALQP